MCRPSIVFIMNISDLPESATLYVGACELSHKCIIELMYASEINGLSPNV